MARQTLDTMIRGMPTRQQSKIRELMLHADDQEGARRHIGIVVAEQAAIDHSAGDSRVAARVSWVDGHHVNEHDLASSIIYPGSSVHGNNPYALKTKRVLGESRREGLRDSAVALETFVTRAAFYALNSLDRRRQAIAYERLVESGQRVYAVPAESLVAAGFTAQSNSQLVVVGAGLHDGLTAYAEFYELGAEATEETVTSFTRYGQTSALYENGDPAATAMARGVDLLRDDRYVLDGPQALSLIGSWALLT